MKDKPDNIKVDDPVDRSDPWPSLRIGLVAIGIGVVLAQVPNPADWLNAGRAVLIGVGLVAVGNAVAIRPSSPLILSVATLSASLASWGVDSSWDTVHLLLRVFVVVGLCASGLVLLPRFWAKVAVSLLVVVHFVGITTAVMSVPPPNGPTLYLTNQLWTRFYRPYLQFVYLNNAYHFYSPEPGPATLLWACIEYTDGSMRWVYLPNRAEHSKDPLALTYYRRISITENINQLMMVLVAPDDAVRRRTIAGQLDGIPTPSEILARMPGIPQYRVPNEHAKLILQSYARFFARAYPSPNADVEVHGVKVYRVVHSMLSPKDFANGRAPDDPTTYWPYFQGEFDREGRLKDAQEPYLYWLLPILQEPEAAGTAASGRRALTDCVEIHAGGKRERKAS